MENNIIIRSCLNLVLTIESMEDRTKITCGMCAHRDIWRVNNIDVSPAKL